MNKAQDILKFIQIKIEGKSGSLTKVFRDFDKDKSGSVDYNEFRQGLLYLGVPLNDKEFDMLIAEVDNDGGGEIDYNEFAEDMKENDAGATLVQGNSQAVIVSKASNQAHGVPKGIGNLNGRGPASLPATVLQYVRDKIEAKSLQIHEVYRHFDENHDMFVTPTEFQHGLAGLGINLRSDQFTALVSHVDANGNGVIDYNEFVDDLKNVDIQTDDIWDLTADRKRKNSDPTQAMHTNPG